MQTLTHSRMDLFRRCRKRHYWAYEEGIRPISDGRALRMGSAGHQALDELKLGHGMPAAIQKVHDCYRENNGGVPEYDWAIERETVECLVVGWEWRWKDEPLHCVESEQQFQLPLINPTTRSHSFIWEVAGKVDGVVRQRDRLAVIEHKFVSDSLEPGSDYWVRLQMDMQITLYFWAMTYVGHPVESVIYDLIRKPSIRPEQIPLVDDAGLKVVLDEHGERALTKQGKPRQTSDAAQGYTLQTRPQTVEEWSDKLLNDIHSRPEWYYARLDIPRTERDVIEMQEEVWDLQKTIRDAQLKGAWYKTVSRDTCPYCPYLQLCLHRWEPKFGECPDGFIKSAHLHPELSEVGE
jgi:hypothetical protein